MHSRRNFLQQLGNFLGATLLAGTSEKLCSAAMLDALPPVRAVTSGPRFHWRGYYDKLLFDSRDRYLLCNEAEFEHRSPEPNDILRVGMVDLQDGDRWIELGKTQAWNWQQGCMLQWLPGTERIALWNDRDGQDFVAHLLDVETGKKRTLPIPIYCVSPDGDWGLSVDFRRLNACRPGYGYAGVDDPYADLAAPSKTGIWKVDFRTGESKLLLSYQDIAETSYQADVDLKYAPGKSKHWFNHLLISPDGKRFLFLHRWREMDANMSREKITKTGFSTRMWTCGADGEDAFVVDPYGKTSHFVWRDPKSICAWAWHPSHRERFYLYHDQSPQVDVVGPDVMTQNGHNTYLPGTENNVILNDTYPDGGRQQHPYLYQISSNKRVALGHFLSPETYQGEWRCDNHPCASRNGRLVAIDSTHEGKGRQVYLIDLSNLNEIFTS